MHDAFSIKPIFLSICIVYLRSFSDGKDCKIVPTMIGMSALSLLVWALCFLCIATNLKCQGLFGFCILQGRIHIH